MRVSWGTRANHAYMREQQQTQRRDPLRKSSVFHRGPPGHGTSSSARRSLPRPRPRPPTRRPPRQRRRRRCGTRGRSATSGGARRDAGGRQRARAVSSANGHCALANPGSTFSDSGKELRGIPDACEVCKTATRCSRARLTLPPIRTPRRRQPAAQWPLNVVVRSGGLAQRPFDFFPVPSEHQFGGGPNYHDEAHIILCLFSGGVSKPERIPTRFVSNWGTPKIDSCKSKDQAAHLRVHVPVLSCDPGGGAGGAAGPHPGGAEAAVSGEDLASADCPLFLLLRGTGWWSRENAAHPGSVPHWQLFMLGREQSASSRLKNHQMPVFFD